jgi:alkylation response protein AidB-like acyl-CoA dehydrogenase
MATPLTTAPSNPALAGKVPTGTPLQRVAALTDVIRDGGDKAQQLRRLPQDCVDALIDAGIFRIAIPKELGGDDATITGTIEILEAISKVDASVGWNVMLGSEINAMAAGGMDKALAKEVFLDNPRVVMCGGGGPGSQPSRAVRQPDGGYRVWGQSTFISGCHNATWCFMMAPLMEGDSIATDANGAPIIRSWFLHKDEYEILDTWDVAGLRGSGSHDVRANGAYVSEKWSSVQLLQLPSHYENPAFRVPVALRLAYNKSAVAIGIARGAIDEFIQIAQTKVPWLTASALRDRPVAQQRLGEAEANLRAARAYLMESMHAVEEELKRGREIPSPETTQAGRLACTHASNASMHVVDLIHNTAGTTAMRMNCPLERKLRDAHGAATHRWVAHPLYAESGKILLGHEATPEFMGLG